MSGFERMFAYGIGALILIVVLSLVWPYLIGFLAVVGAVQIYHYWRQRGGRF